MPCEIHAPVRCTTVSSLAVKSVDAGALRHTSDHLGRRKVSIDHDTEVATMGFSPEDGSSSTGALHKNLIYRHPGYFRCWKLASNVLNDAS